MQGVVTGLEAMTNGWSKIEAIGVAWSRALKAYREAGMLVEMLPRHITKLDYPPNIDAVVVTVSIDSSLWTGRS